MSNKTLLNQGTTEFLNSTNDRLGLLTGTLETLDFSGETPTSECILRLSPGLNASSTLSVSSLLDITTDSSTGDTIITTNDYKIDTSGDITIQTGVMDIDVSNEILFNNTDIIKLTSGTNIHFSTDDFYSNISGSTSDPTSILRISGTTYGMLLPQMTTTQRNSISSPATGLMLYNTTENKINVRSNIAWRNLQYKSEIIMRVALFTFIIPASGTIVLTTQYSTVGDIQKGCSINNTTGIITLNPPISSSLIVASFNLLPQIVPGPVEGVIRIRNTGGTELGEGLGYRYSDVAGSRSEFNINGSIFFNYTSSSDRQITIEFTNNNAFTCSMNGNFSLVFFYSI